MCIERGMALKYQQYLVKYSFTMFYSKQGGMTFILGKINEV